MGEGEHLVMGILWITVGAGGIYRAHRQILPIDTATVYCHRYAT
jgi:hypothetical protein